MSEIKEQRPQTTAQRQETFRNSQRELGRRRSEFWLTDDERAQLTALLAQLRRSN